LSHKNIHAAELTKYGHGGTRINYRLPSTSALAELHFICDHGIKKRHSGRIAFRHEMKKRHSNEQSEQQMLCHGIK
jgi:hypothetical protein